MATIIVPSDSTGYPDTADADYPTFDAATEKVVMVREALMLRGDAANGFVVEVQPKTQMDLDVEQLQQIAAGSGAAAALARCTLALLS